MPIEKYDIFFSGCILPGQDEAEVQAKIGQMFKAGADQLAKLFSGNPVKIKSSVDLDTAGKYRVTFRNAGALVDIRPAVPDVQPDQTRPSPDRVTDTGTAPAHPPQEPEGMSLLPPRTGSLIDCSPVVTPAPIPDISGLSLSDPGVIIDGATPPPPARIDTSGLTLAPPGAGNLEENRQPAHPDGISDIRELKITPPGEEE